MCQHRKMRAVRAVKILKKAALKQEEIERFIHEIEILKTLVSYLTVLLVKDHPNILRLYEFYEDPKRYYIVTELCTGGELFDEITTKT